MTAGAALVLLFCGTASCALADGRSTFNNYCRTCHSLGRGDNRLGPSLYGIVGSRAGSVAGFSRYSQSLLTSSIIWDALTLDRFIADPESVVQNNNMKPFDGIADAALRAQIIEFLKRNGP